MMGPEEEVEGRGHNKRTEGTEVRKGIACSELAGPQTLLPSIQCNSTDHSLTLSSSSPFCGGSWESKLLRQAHLENGPSPSLK